MKDNNIKLFLLVAGCFLLLVFTSSAQESRPYEIHDFSGGINTNDNIWQIKPNQSFQSRDWVLDDPTGALTIRPGFISVFDTDTVIYSLFSHRFINGNDYMFMSQHHTTSVGNKIARFNEGSLAAYDDGVNIRLKQHLYPIRGVWSSWLDNIYFFDGVNLPRIILDAGSSTEDHFVDAMIPIAPGQPWVINQGIAGNLKGDYMYCILAEVPCSTLVFSKRPGPFSTKINFKNEQAYIGNIYPTIDADGCTIPASQTYRILRTRADKFNATDSLFEVYELTKTNTDDPFFLLYIDNTADASLDTDSIGVGGDYWGLIGWVGLAYTSRYTQDSVISNDANDAYTPGSLTRLALDTGTHSGDISDLTADHTYNAYTITFIDTLTGRESDTTRSLWVWAVYGGDGLNDVTLGLPMIPDYLNEHYVRILYRAKIMLDWDVSLGPGPNFVGKPFENPYIFYALDTIVLDTQTTYWDTLSWDSSEGNDWGISVRNEPLDNNPLLDIFEGAIIHEARMFTWTEQRVYASNYDTAEFNPIENVTFDMDDGDRIIGIASFEGYIVVYKTKSIWILYTDDGVIVDRAKRSVDYGMISFASLDNYHGSNIYLGIDGITFEKDSRYRSNKIIREFLTDDIKNIFLRSVDEMATMVGQTFDDKALYSYPGTDSTFVYFFKTGGWLIWSFSFSDAVLFDTVSINVRTPYDKLYFSMEDSSQIFLYDSGDTSNNGTDFVGVWEKKYIGISYLAQFLETIHLWKDIIAPAEDSITIFIEDENGNSIDVLGFDSLSFKYDYSHVLSDKAHWFSIRIECPNFLNATINGLDLQIMSNGIDVRR